MNGIMRILVQAVKCNIERFPEDFMFQLNPKEFANLKSQIVISNWGGVRASPYAFTEQGISMLSRVLRSARAIQVNIEIMRASQVAGYLRRLATLEKKYDIQFKAVFDAIRELMTPAVTQEETLHRLYRRYWRRRKMNGILNCGKRCLRFL